MGQGQAGCGILAKGTEGPQLPHCWAVGSELPPAGTCHPSLGSTAVFATAVFRNQRAERLGNFWLRLLNCQRDARWRDGVVLTFAPCERQRFSPLTPRRCTPCCPVLSSRAAPKPCAATPSCTPRPHMPAGGFSWFCPPFTWALLGVRGLLGKRSPMLVLRLQASLAILLLHLLSINSLSLSSPHPKATLVPGPTCGLLDESHSSHSTVSRCHLPLPIAGAPLPGSCCRSCEGARSSLSSSSDTDRGSAASRLYQAVPQAFWVAVEDFRSTLLLPLAATCDVLGV